MRDFLTRFEFPNFSKILMSVEFRHLSGKCTLCCAYQMVSAPSASRVEGDTGIIVKKGLHYGWN